ncbi:hypothetical protein Sme01_51570 [Sphaerisporangium melleum]|uniref:HTH cro/C1-type domain-containing protein n=1 Tax=Sphaerisporangium melleum TaxID=321316 RepID=A0A917QYP1_9ACTN|nr:helix-turn-helix transcriptional regulator [Sphaerisporangium melleum]GGK75880.1 hypothetical protein GCM10007964_18330 [Sphaerisporangium melleum]GII72681.1 hypothetical protein Sme01_51570 [Sphaerisporangium melleum]
MSADPIDPHASLWHLFGAVMRRCREGERKIALRRAAADLYIDFSNLAKWERGERTPPPDMIQRLDQVYGAQGILTALYGMLLRLNAVAESERVSAGMSPATPRHRDGDDDMERRTALQLLAGLSTVGAIGVSGEPVRQLLDASLGQEYRAIEEWEVVCADHLHALRTRPPVQVATDLLVDLLALRHQIDTAPPTVAPDLHRVMAVLGDIHASALTRLGDHGAAIRWWRTARQSADTSGDLGLRLLVRGDEAGHGLYGQRAPETVLHLVRQAQHLAGGSTVDFLTTEVKALSLLGRHDEALAALNTLHTLAEKGVAADRYGFWSPSQVHFADSWVYAATGHEARADTARESVLQITRDYQYRANVQLHEALCMVVQGGINEGMRHAMTTLDYLSPAYRSRHIIETGRMVRQAVPRDRQSQPSVTEFRVLLAHQPTISS